MTCKERILSNEYADGVVDFPLESLIDENSDACYIELDDRYSVVYQNRSITSELSESVYQYRYVPRLYGLMQKESEVHSCQNESIGMAGPFDPTFLVESGIRQLQGPPLQLDGQGTIIAIIDTGIDYQNPAFLDAEGNSRILAIWDQTDQTGTPPDGYVFGSQYLREDINRALRAEDPFSIVPTRDELLHGTIMAGIAAGGRSNIRTDTTIGGSAVRNISDYQGAAPRAELVIVKLKESKDYLRNYYFIPDGVPAYEETDIMLGIKYADSFGQSFARPVIICLGLGTNTGDHAGNSLLDRYMNRIADKRSRVVVVCGGNEGNAGHHYMGNFSRDSNDNPLPEDVEIRVGENNRGFFLEFWGGSPDTYNVAVRSPGGENIPPLRLGIEQSGTYRFIFEDTVFTIQSVLVEPGAGEELILFRVENPTAGIWTFRIIPVGSSSNGTYHLWLPIKNFLTSETYFLEPEPDITLTAPSLARDVITVSAYNYVNNSFYLESGRGFSRDGSIKPDVAAPGVNIPTLFGNRTGSSLAAAVTAGGAAQFMQWAVVEGNNPLASSREVKNYFIKGAVRMPGTEYPNREWGYGRLNVIGAFEVLRG